MSMESHQHATDPAAHADHDPQDHHGGPDVGQHGGHAGHDGHGDHVGQFRRLFWIMLTLAVPVIAFSPAMAEANRAVKEFLFAHMYRHWRVNRMTSKARHVTEALFGLLHADVSLLPDGWRAQAGERDGPRAALTVCDYIAGMTDRFALEEHRRLTDPFHIG